WYAHADAKVRVSVISEDEEHAHTFPAWRGSGEPATKVKLRKLVVKRVGWVTLNVTAMWTPAVVVETTNVVVRAWSGPLALTPLVTTLSIAVATRSVVLALFSGVFAANLIKNDMSLTTAFARSFDHTLLNALTEEAHACVVVFCVFLGGMVALMTRAGGI